jgi:hypothetical protein
MKTDTDASAGAVAGQVDRHVRPAAGIVLDESGWPVLTGRGNEDAFIKHRRGERVYSQTALDAAVAAERERWGAHADAMAQTLEAFEAQGSDKTAALRAYRAFRA